MHFALSLLSFLPYFQVRPLFTPFLFMSFICIPFSCAPIIFLCSHFPFWVVLLSLMVYSSEIRRTSPSIAFFFARLRALVDSHSDTLGAFSSSDPYPQIGDFVVVGSGLGLVLGDLYPLLHKSLAWFKSIRGDLRRENMGSKVRSGNLERGSSFNVGTVGAGVDMATSAPSCAPLSSHPSASAAPRSFQALKEKCTLKIEVFSKFRDRFQFPNERLGLVFLGRVRRLMLLLMERFVFMRLRFCAASNFSSIRSS